MHVSLSRSYLIAILMGVGVKASPFDSKSSKSIGVVPSSVGTGTVSGALPLTTPTDFSMSSANTAPFSTPTFVTPTPSGTASSTTSNEVAFSTVDFTFTFIPVSTITVTEVFCPSTQSTAISCPCITECPTASTSATPITFSTPDMSTAFSVPPSQTSASSEFSASLIG